MKKILVLLLALIFVISGCAKEEIPVNEPNTEKEAAEFSEENAPAKMEIKAVSEGEIAVEIENISGAEIIFSEDFSLQFMENGKWYSLDAVLENYGFNDIAYPIQPGEIREWKNDFTWLYGKLPEGEYRIIKTVLTEESGKYERFRISAEFEIKPETEDRIAFENPEVPAETEAPENSFVLRANSPSGESEGLLWYHAENEKENETDRPVLILENMAELNSFLMDMEGIYFWGDSANSAEEQFRKYDEAFFENSVLVVSHIRASSGSVRYEVTGIDVADGKCTLRVSAKIPQVGTADIADWFIIVEQPKEILSGINEFALAISIKR